MTKSRARFTIIITAALAIAPLAAAAAQEIGPFVGAGVGGIRDVRRPFGGGIAATLLYHDWLGIRGDAGYYYTLEHRTGLYCLNLANEPGQRCVSNATLRSHSSFPLLDAMAVLRAHIPHKGVRFEVGAGPSWQNVSTHISANNDSLPPTDVKSARAGAVFMAGLLAHPDWKIPITLEGMYLYHMSGAFGACDATRPNDPLCGQHLNFHEIRFSLLWRPRNTTH